MTHYEYRMIAGIVWGAAYAVATLMMELWLSANQRAIGNTDKAIEHMQTATLLHEGIKERKEHYTRAGED